MLLLGGGVDDNEAVSERGACGDGEIVVDPGSRSEQQISDDYL